MMALCHNICVWNSKESKIWSRRLRILPPVNFVLKNCGNDSFLHYLGALGLSGLKIKNHRLALKFSLPNKIVFLVGDQDFSLAERREAETIFVLGLFEKRWLGLEDPSAVSGWKKHEYIINNKVLLIMNRCLVSINQ